MIDPRERFHGWARPFLLTVLVLILGTGVLRSSALREDEVQCEEAAAHLADCCDNFNPHSLDCSYFSGCGTSYPKLTNRESTCIQDASCADLHARGICDLFAQGLPEGLNQRETDDGTWISSEFQPDSNADRLGVCP